ncbi:Ribulose bisphosphate carboxylase/oxygenase activase, chloroplastic [Morella rubra]|uniref:Ribulose bisphosphate carboxylase/oxygenase activase, chloroplastic n=1 Tax=Morella rubra TaxID=262757 RepID=A0A6A1VNK1_9ROSI|nr:Ribulose bisphosphate carboxylase/oxygenase activase, chloroplastic [Morella rubra]
MAVSSFSSPFKPTCPLHFPPLPFTNKTTLPFFSLRCSKSSLPEKNDDGENDSRSEPKSPKRLSKQSSWEAKDLEGRDYLYRLGKEADNMNIAVGARAGVIDDLFAGNFLGRDSDIVFDYRQKVTRSFEYLQGDYYIAPVFMDKVGKFYETGQSYTLILTFFCICFAVAAVTHIVKNYISHLLNTKVPLILGIWGGKGQGKSFQTELIFQTMGVEPVIMSAGELESERAGEPGKLIRDRYRTASQVVQNQVRSFTTSTVDISDIVFDYRQKVTRSFEYLQGDYYIAPVFMDKVGKFYETGQSYTLILTFFCICFAVAAVTHIVKNYISHLLNTKVPLILGIWGGKGQGKSFQTELIFQTMGVEPVIMSAGELESERAGEPGKLIRDRYRTASQVVQNQGKMSCLMINDIDAGLGRFALDFYGALRSRTYDRSISKWIDDIGGVEKLGDKLLRRKKTEKLPAFTPPKQTVEALLESGYSLIKEQRLARAHSPKQSQRPRLSALTPFGESRPPASGLSPPTPVYPLYGASSQKCYLWTDISEDDNLTDFASGKATKDLGYYLAVITLDSIGEGRVRQQTGDVMFPVVFSGVTFKLYSGEILEGVVHKITPICLGGNPVFNDNQSKIEKDVVVRVIVIGTRWMEAEREFHVLDRWNCYCVCIDRIVTNDLVYRRFKGAHAPTQSHRRRLSALTPFGEGRPPAYGLQPPYRLQPCTRDGLLKLHNDVQTCGYQDVQVMWEMLSRSESGPLGNHPKRKRRPFWRVFPWSNHNAASTFSADQA